MSLKNAKTNTVKYHQLAVVIGCLFSLGILGYLDYITGDYSLIIFYMIPVAASSWFIGIRTGIIFSLLSGGVRLYSDVIANGNWLSYSQQRYWNLGMEIIFLAMMGILTAYLKQALDHENKLARLDDLTGAFNRRAFFDIASYELERARRYKHPFTLLYIDLDNFKKLNDTSGHHAGDNALQIVVTAIQEHIRKVDLLARLGGDEFVVILPELALDNAPVLLNNIHERLRHAMVTHNLPITFSMGAVTYLAHPKSIDEIMLSADKLMYEAKNTGKNRLIHKIVDFKINCPDL